MESGNLFQTKRILNMNNNDFSSSVRDTNFNKYNNLFSETNYSNYRRDRDLFYNSIKVEVEVEVLVFVDVILMKIVLII